MCVCVCVLLQGFQRSSIISPFFTLIPSYLYILFNYITALHIYQLYFLYIYVTFLLHYFTFFNIVYASCISLFIFSSSLSFVPVTSFIMFLSNFSNNIFFIVLFFPFLIPSALYLIIFCCLLFCQYLF